MAFQIPVRRGENHPLAKLDNATRRECRDLWRAGSRQITDLAREHGVDRRTMGRIVHQPRNFLDNEG